MKKHLPLRRELSTPCDEDRIVVECAATLKQKQFLNTQPFDGQYV